MNAHRRDAYRVFMPITTRWHDNDIYGHVNNVVYYSYFDTAVNQYLIEEGGLDIHASDVIGYVVNSQCDYFSAVGFPQALEAGLCVNRIGNSSVQYGVGIFQANAEKASAQGSLTHVFVSRQTQRPTAIPMHLREALQRVQGKR